MPERSVCGFSKQVRDTLTTAYIQVDWTLHCVMLAVQNASPRASTIKSRGDARYDLSVQCVNTGEPSGKENN